MAGTARQVTRSREAERRLAKIVGGKRNPSTGIKDVPDVETEIYAHELKSLQSLPQWIVKAWEQAERCAVNVSKIPWLVLEERRPGGKNVRFFIQAEEWSIQRTCLECNQVLPLRYFFRNSHLTQQRKRKSTCRECIADRAKKRAESLRERLRTFKEMKGCADCGLHDVRILDFDHLPGFEGGISPMKYAALGRLSACLEEIEKCEVVCANCHRIRTVERNG